MKVCLLAVCMAALFAGSAVGAQPQPLTWELGYDDLTLNLLDSQVDDLGQRTIYNVTDNCRWNDQDKRTDLGIGYVDAGVTLDHTMCIVADYDDRREPPGTGTTAYPKVAVFRVFAPGNTLQVSLTNDVGGMWVSPPSVVYGNQRLWQLCVRDPVADGGNISHDADLPSYWSLVPGSSAGYGQIVHYTLHIASLGKRTNSVSAFFEVAHGAPFPQRTNYSVPCPQTDGL